jgi:ribose-phosphate pyrophosphokinase
MIKISGKEIKMKHFPDGTQCLLDVDASYLCYLNNAGVEIEWYYENDEELVTLIYLVNHLRNKVPNTPLNLFMPYVPNARMDRTKKDCEVFTLKYFTKIINGLKFSHVYVLDPHSDVTPALLDNVVVLSPEKYIKTAIESIKQENNINSDEDLLIYFPDAGAYKRYKDLEVFNSFEKIYGKKVRDWSTGKIVGLDIVDKDERPFEIFEEIDYSNPDTFDPDRFVKVKPLKGKFVLMIDDIISYGGTMYYSAKKLDELGAKEIFAYATHVEGNSFWDIEKGTFRNAFGLTDAEGREYRTIVKKLYTTDSIYLNKPNDLNIVVVQNLKV